MPVVPWSSKLRKRSSAPRHPERKLFAGPAGAFANGIAATILTFAMRSIAGKLTAQEKTAVSDTMAPDWAGSLLKVVAIGNEGSRALTAI